MNNMPNTTDARLLAAADAAYATWREEVGDPREPLAQQDSGVRARWQNVAAAVLSAAALHDVLDASREETPVPVRFQAPAPPTGSLEVPR